MKDFETFTDGLGDWKPALSKHFESSTFKSLFKFLQTEYSSQTIYPPKDMIFNAFRQAKFDDLKVVIIGQDPYIKENEAMGLSFSVPKTTKCPPSLQQIYHALDNDPEVDFKRPNPLHGDLTQWAK